MNDTLRRATAPITTLLSLTALLCLGLFLGSCKKEEPVDPVVSVNMTVNVNAPSALLDVAEIVVAARTSTSLVTKSVDSPDWTYVVPLTDGSVLDSAVPVHLDVTLKGKAVDKGTPIDAGVTYTLLFDTLFESGKTERIATFEKKNAARIIWISSTGKYGSLLPLNFSWRGDLKTTDYLPARYIVNDLMF